MRTLDEEREYLEGLLTSRFNFYFVFAGAIAAGATQLDDPMEQGVLFLVAFIISLLFWRALFRTYVLVREIIKEIDKIEGHPLQLARARAEGYVLLRQANYYVGQLVPGALTLAFLCLGTFRLWQHFA